MAEPADHIRCIILCGQGGVGKSALIQQFAATEAARMFPDGCIWIDATNLGRELPSAARRCGWQSGETDSDEDDAAALEASRWLSSVLQTKRLLLVVDNLDYRRAQAMELPVASGAGRIVATARSPVLRDELGQPAVNLPVGCWDASESRAYVLAIYGRPSTVTLDATIDQLTAVVGHLPLGVRLLAKLLARAGTEPQELLHRIQNDPVRTLDSTATGADADRAVASTFMHAYKALDAESRSVLAAIGACARATRLQVLTAVTGMSEESVRVSLDRLLNQDALIDFSLDVPRPYGMHDLLRHFLGTIVGIADAQDAHLRFAFRHADLHQGPLQWKELDVDVIEVLAATDSCIARRDALNAFRLLQKVRAHLLRCHEPQSLESRLSALLPLLGTSGVEAKTVFLHLGICAARQARPEEARRNYRRSLRIATERGETAGRALALGNIAITYRGEANYCRAVGYSRAALRLNESLERLGGKARQLRQLGRMYTDMGDVERALPMVLESIEISSTLERSGKAAIEARSTLANCYTQIGRHEDAETLRLESLRIQREKGAVRAQVMVLAALSNGYRLWADDALPEHRTRLVDKSLQTATECSSSAMRIRYLSGEIEGLFSLGDTMRMTGQFDLAFDLLGRAMALTEQHNRQRFHAMVLLAYGRTQIESGALDGGHETVQRADTLFGRIGVRATHRFRVLALGLLASRPPRAS